MLISLIYGSSATQNFSDEELLDILSNAEKNNAKLGITGILLYKSGNFLQVLEGEEDVVIPLYEKIQQDIRHHSVMTIYKRQIKDREFGDWSMGFVNLGSDEFKNIPGYNDFLNKSLDPKEFMQNPSHARVFLRNFKELMR